MKVLLDHCVPRSFGRILPGHSVSTTKEMGWENLDNGVLLDAAAAEFGAFITVDSNLAKQQHLGQLPIPVIAIAARSNSITSLRPAAPLVLKLLGQQLQRRVYPVIAS